MDTDDPAAFAFSSSEKPKNASGAQIFSRIQRVFTYSSGEHESINPPVLAARLLLQSVLDSKIIDCKLCLFAIAGK